MKYGLILLRALYREPDKVQAIPSCPLGVKGCRNSLQADGAGGDAIRLMGLMGMRLIGMGLTLGR